jgi:hypothetical protein
MAGTVNCPVRSAPAAKARYSVTEIDEVEAVGRELNKIVDDFITSEGLFRNGEPRHAFVTFVTPEYHWGLVVWLRSLRQVSDKPVFLLVSREMRIPQAIDGVFMIVVPGLYHDRSNFERAEYLHVLNKLWIFALLALDRIFFVDVDCVFLKPVDELFARSEILVCPDYVETRATEKFNSGVIVFCPDKALFTRMLLEINVVTSDDGGDQGYLNAILRDDVVFVHEKYNLTRHFKYFSGATDLNDVRIIHYIVKKPWSLQYQETPDGLLVDLDDLWTSFLSPHERGQLIAEWRRSIFHISERRRIENVGPKALAFINKRLDDLEAQLNDRRRRLQDAAKLAFAALAGACAAYVALRIWS